MLKLKYNPVTILNLSRVYHNISMFSPFKSSVAEQFVLLFTIGDLKARTLP